MIEYIEKDLTTVGMGIVAHGVNCQHKMGSGVAKAIREKWPTAYNVYMAEPKGKAMLGTANMIAVGDLNDQLWVANCYTQVFYGYGGGQYADADAIERSIGQVAQWADIYNLPIFMPKIGCGLGGLKWEDVLPGVERINENNNRVTIYICDLPIGK